MLPKAMLVEILPILSVYFTSFPKRCAEKKYLIFSEIHLIDRLDPDRSGQFFDYSYFNRQGVADKPFNDFFRNNDGDLIFFFDFSQRLGAQ
jgi:hypothetical protein|tara:strand:- start:27882 stop:28154 length:273 start_codon:yes stop_codon:yes gene_type:complete